MRSRTARMPTGSSPLVGSSRSRSAGSPRGAPPRARRQAEEVRVVLVQLAGRGPAGELELLGEVAEETSRRPVAGRPAKHLGPPTRGGDGADEEQHGRGLARPAGAPEPQDPP